MVNNKIFFAVLSLSVVHCSLRAQSDTVRVRKLPEVRVTAAPRVSAYLSTSAAQTLSSDRLAKLNALQVSDALKHFSGVQVKDYGGVGGLKTVSVRSLGAAHTQVIYDGFAVTDYQSGQTDLGQFSLDNIESLSLHIGESDQLFQTAQAQLLAGAIRIYTHTLPNDKTTEFKANLRAGSFDLLHSSLYLGRCLNSVFSLTAAADYLTTKGDYPFTQQTGSEAVGRRRNHSEVDRKQLEANLHGRFRNAGQLAVKVQGAFSDRNLPGPAIYYNDYAGENLRDNMLNTQAHYEQPLGERWKFQANAKYSSSRRDYTNAPLHSVNYTIRYDQADYYANLTLLYKVSERLSLAWATDGDYGRFRSSWGTNVSPSRLTGLSALSAQYKTGRWSATAKLLGVWADNRSERGDAPADYRHLSPYVGLSVQPIAATPLRLRVFYKNTYYMPTFGDIYLSSMPSLKLRPEDVHQYDVGAVFMQSWGEAVPYFSLSVDGYWNRIKDKLVAVPTSSMANWSVVNLGKAEISGLDVNLALQGRMSAAFRWNVQASYTYQNPLNKTAPTSTVDNYNKRLIYTALHSASASAGLQTPWAELTYNLLYCGDRYASDDNRASMRMKPFAEHSFAVLRTFAFRPWKLTLKAECLNAANEQYDVVRNYPMPGRAFRVGIKIEY